MFRAGSFERLAVPLSLVARLEEIPLSRMERAGGRRVVQYRGRILPLASLAPILEPSVPSGATDGASLEDPAQVVVFDNGGRSVGILVDRILDIVEDQVTVRQAAARPGLLGSAVIGGQVADLLDLHAVIQAADAGWFGGQDGFRAVGATAMVAEASSFVRGLLRNSLEMAGYRVVEAADTAAALRELQRRQIDVVLAGPDLPPDGGRGLLEQMRRLPALAQVPTLALTGSAGQAQTLREQLREFSDCQMIFDREAVLGSLARLTSAVATP
jgi:two-component system chemotaxis sensor kinase CheA